MRPAKALYIHGVLYLTAALFYTAAQADGEHLHASGHPPQDQYLHNTFYSTWRQKDANHTSCCNERDCYPTRAKFDQATGMWEAERREDGKWILIPLSVYNQEDPSERRSPDGRAHLCAPPPSVVTGEYYHTPSNIAKVHRRGRKRHGDVVYCFVPGTGI